ncbi:hypothetical protein [Methylomonas fluvii]|uniref:Tc1-like transposase DDE domain-containing protein n=1 Tax=Methylomonas fluvii TaxID=1854564 RepID=A0ABR9DH94_9GAMM|nr:hypothetical protein [Methylomonas fluvii]MBD9361658.1 hypothetical protein [Methylomonas fluvii]
MALSEYFWFFGFLVALIEGFNKPLVAILDNASIHNAKKTKAYWDLLVVLQPRAKPE